MTLKNRFMIVGLGMIVFILITPVIILYALGYKLDLQARQVVKTGSLIIFSRPEKAQIYIDDTLQAKKTDGTIRFLLPGDYNVKVSKAGYQSWTKRLNVKSSLVTWANHEREFITLFYEQPIVSQNKEVSQSAISIMERKAVASEKGRLSEYDPDSGEFKSMSTALPTLPAPITFSNKSHLYYWMRYPSASFFTPEQLAAARQLQANESYATALVGSDLMVVKNNVASAYSGNVSGFILENEHLWYVQDNQVKHVNLAMGIIDPVTTLHYSPFNSIILRGNSHLFLVLDQTLYALNDKLEEVQRGVSYAYWDEPTSRLVVATSNEALLFDPVSFKKDLIIRSSTAITQPIVNKETGYLFFLNENKLKAIELDGRDHRNVYTISTDPANSFLVSQDGSLATLFTDLNIKTLNIRE
jgi:hypothetical protein